MMNSMSREEILKLMQNYVLQLKTMSERGTMIQGELLKMTEDDAKWYEENFSKWLKENNLQK